jgi:hypothetical protein
MPPIGDEELERWLSAVPRAEWAAPGEVVWLCSDVEESGLDLNRVRIWVEDKGGWGFFDNVEVPYFELPEAKAPAHDPDQPTFAEHLEG